MKKVLFILTMLIISLQAKPQAVIIDELKKTIKSKQEINSDRYDQYDIPVKNKNLSAGEELKKASNHFYTGVICTFSGTLITIGGSCIKPNYNGRYVVMGCGGVISLIGIIYGIESFSHIYKAGVKLDKNKSDVGLYLKQENTNLTLTYKF